MHRTHALLFALIILLAAALGAQAASSESVYCGDLTPADCQLKQASADRMNALTSLAFDADINMRFDFGDSTTITGRLSGDFEMDAESLQAIEALADTASAANLSALADLALASAKANVSLDMSAASEGEDFDLVFSFQLQDGVLFVDAQALEALTGESMEGVDGLGIDLTGAMSLLLVEAGGATSMEKEASKLDESAMKAAEAAATTIARLPDSEVNGLPVAVFETNIDVNMLMSLPEFERMVADHGGFDEAGTLLAALESMDVKQMRIIEHIGLDDGYAHRVDMALDMTTTLPDGDGALDAAIVMAMSVDLSRFNQPVAVAMPQELFALPLAMMLQMSQQ